MSLPEGTDVAFVSLSIFKATHYIAGMEPSVRRGLQVESHLHSHLEVTAVAPEVDVVRDTIGLDEAKTVL